MDSFLGEELEEERGVSCYLVSPRRKGTGLKSAVSLDGDPALWALPAQSRSIRPGEGRSPDPKPLWVVAGSFRRSHVALAIKAALRRRV